MPPKVFLSFFLEDKASTPDVFVHPLRAIWVTFSDGQFCVVTRYDVIGSGGQAIFEWKYFFFNVLNNKSNYYMAKPVLGKSVRSDWFLLGRNFAVRTVSMETVQEVYFWFGAKPPNSKFATTTAKLPEKATKIEILHRFQRWMKKTNIRRASSVLS